MPLTLSAFWNLLSFAKRTNMDVVFGKKESVRVQVPVPLLEQRCSQAAQPRKRRQQRATGAWSSAGGRRGRAALHARQTITETGCCWTASPASPATAVDGRRNPPIPWRWRPPEAAAQQQVGGPPGRGQRSCHLEGRGGRDQHQRRQVSACDESGCSRSNCSVSCPVLHRTVRIWLKRDVGSYWPSVCHIMPGERGARWR